MNMDAVRAKGASLPDALASIVGLDGSATHDWVRNLAETAGARDLADAVHHLLMLHGRHPGIFDHAGRHATGAAAAWLAEASDEFADERSHLARLVVAAGPLPSTPGHAESDAAMVAQCHAVEMLARSDRTGCALGAALALALDWSAVRRVLDAAATRFAVPVARPILLPAAVQAIALDALAVPARQRAVAFGARQMLLQHRGLWDLLEARAAARHPA